MPDRPTPMHHITETLPTSRRLLWALWLVIGLGLLLRLIVIGTRDPLAVYLSSGGDTLWYMVNGWAFFSGRVSGEVTLIIDGIVRTIPFMNSALPTPPLYLMLVGAWQHLLPPIPAVIAIWLTQALMGTATVWFGWRLARALAGPGAGLIAAVGLALHPALVQDAAIVLTETTYIFFVMAGLWLVVERVRPQRSRVAGDALLAGAVFGLATLTRAVFLLFPLSVAGLWLVRDRRRGLALAGLLLIAYAGIVGTWTLHNLLAHDRFVIVSDQFTPALWRGAVVTDGSPQENDAQLAGTTPGAAAVDAITGDFGGWLALRARELLSANLQPHGTIALGGESLRALVADWWRTDRSLSGLVHVTQGDYFWAKLLMYVWHYAGLVFGLIGIWVARRNPQALLPLAGFIAYTLIVHSVLIAEPRYIFPTQAVWWVLAGAGLAAIFRRRGDRSAAARP